VTTVAATQNGTSTVLSSTDHHLLQGLTVIVAAPTAAAAPTVKGSFAELKSSTVELGNQSTDNRTSVLECPDGGFVSSVTTKGQYTAPMITLQ
jgi:hypothetical protein